EGSSLRGDLAGDVLGGMLPWQLGKISPFRPAGHLPPLHGGKWRPDSSKQQASFPRLRGKVPDRAEEGAPPIEPQARSITKPPPHQTDPDTPGQACPACRQPHPRCPERFPPC